MLYRPLCLALLILCSVDRVWAEDWPQWLGPERTGISKEKGLLPTWPADGPKLLWTFRDAGIGFSSVAVVGDRLYTMGGEGNKEYVYALDLNTQKKLWSTEVGRLFESGYQNGPSCTPTVDGELLYAIGGLGRLVCLETASGKEVWFQELKKDLGGLPPGFGYSQSPLVDGDVLLVAPGGKKGAMAAFDKKSGRLKWRCANYTDQACHSSMIAAEVGGVRQYIHTSWENAVGVRASDGKLLWKVPFHMGISTPMCWNDCVYVSAWGCDKLIKLTRERDLFQAKEVYTKPQIGSYHGGVIRVGDHVYGHSQNLGWVCQEFKTGKMAWNFKKKGAKSDQTSSGSMTVADGNLYCYSEDGTIRLIQAAPAGCKLQGKLCLPERSDKWVYKTTYTYPVIANGKLYLRDHELIFCYDVRKP